MRHRLPAARAEKSVCGLRVPFHQRIPTRLRPLLDDFLGRRGLHRGTTEHSRHRHHHEEPRNVVRQTHGPDHSTTVLRGKTIQVESPRQTNSQDFYNSVLFLQQPLESAFERPWRSRPFTVKLKHCLNARRACGAAIWALRAASGRVWRELRAAGLEPARAAVRARVPEAPERALLQRAEQLAAEASAAAT